ncbi:TetR/AcrR family transcriptional regulator [Pseudomonas aeruginosa]|nr:TetR/AcrR family transcriptional regulator [Pseudomonas aeruginosa]
MDRSKSRKSAAIERTRVAILDAAVRVLIYKSFASYAEIADAAGTARSTLHRHFPERADLIAGLQAYAGERILQAKAQARLGEGPALDALMRLAEEYLDLGDLVIVAFAERDGTEQPKTPDLALDEILLRGSKEGTIDASIPALWLEQLLWITTFSAWSHIRTNHVPQHEAFSLALKALRKIVSP